MTSVRVFISRALDLLLRRRRDERLTEEMQTHLDLLTDEYIASGMPPDDARHAARRAFGGVDQAKAIYRDQRGLPSIDGLLQDLRFATRLLMRERRFTVAAVTALALGIGANTAIFSLIESLMLRPLPVRDPAQLAVIADSSDTSRRARSYAVWQAIWNRRAIFDGAMAWSSARFNLSERGEARLIDGFWASGNTFETLGVPAMLGRTFTQTDDVWGGGPSGPVAVISYAFWQREFGGAADAVGRTLMIGDVPITIVGIAPPEFFGLEVGRAFDIALPLGTEPLLMRDETALESRSTRWLTVMARLKPSQSLDEAIAALRGVQSQIREETLPEGGHPTDLAAYLKTPLTLVPAGTGDSALRSRYERPLFAILAVVALVLLIACGNVANLLLARAAARRHEWSVRLAMGASRWRLARQLLAESLLLSSASAILGVAIAQWTSQLLVRELSTPASRVFLDLSIDGRVLLFTIAVTVLTALIFGTAPALRAASTSPIDAIKEHGRGTTDRGRISVTNGLVVAQVALSVVLLASAGLFIRTFSTLANRDLGFDRERILIVNVNARQANIGARDRLAAYGRLREGVLAVPGVAAAALSFYVPLTGGGRDNRVTVSGSSPLPEGESWSRFNAVSPGWFATFGVRILAGRDVADGDKNETAPVILVSEAFARRFFNSANPMGRAVVIQRGGTSLPPREIVGLVADVAYDSPREQPAPTMYVPLAQSGGPGEPEPAGVIVSARSETGSPAFLARSVGAAVTSVNPELEMTFRPIADQVRSSLTQERLVAVLAGLFGLLALLLAAFGLYGVTSYAVAQRRPEIGVRMALGAAPAAVIGLVLTRVSGLVGLGLIVGIALSAWATQFVATLLFGLEPTDPITLLGAALALASVGLLAGWLPARRAARIDPVSVLRES